VDNKMSRVNPAEALSSVRILLVEDGEANRKLCSLLLRRAGAKVVTAENGQIGVKTALTQSFDLILMDMQMPVMDGYTAATQLRQEGITIPIIALTAHALQGDEAKCRMAGCSGYLSKPIDSATLLRKVAGAIGVREDAPGGKNSTIGVS
jgi:two-component system, sensor histidine kinase